MWWPVGGVAVSALKVGGSRPGLGRRVEFLRQENLIQIVSLRVDKSGYWRQNTGGTLRWIAPHLSYRRPVAQSVERLTAVREFLGSSPRPHQHSGS